MTSNISSDVFMLGFVGKGAVESRGTDGKRCNQVNVLDTVFRSVCNLWSTDVQFNIYFSVWLCTPLIENAKIYLGCCHVIAPQQNSLWHLHRGLWRPFS